MLRVTVQWTTGPGTPYYTLFWYGGNAAPEGAAAHAATADFCDAMEALTVDNLVYQVNPEVDVVNALTGQTTATFLATTTFHQGSVTGDPLPWSNQALIRWRTGEYINGREIRGRTFWPGLNDGLVVDGVLTASGVTEFNNRAAAHLANGDTSAAGGAVIYSPTNQQPAAITQGQVWNQIAVLRSRRP